MVLTPIAKFTLAQNLSGLVGLLNRDGIVHRITEADGFQVLYVDETSDSVKINALIREFSESIHALESDNREGGFKTAFLSMPSGRAIKENIRRISITYPFTVGTLIIAIVCFLFQAWISPPGLVRWLHFVPVHYMFETGELWRMVTPIFMHFSILHILFNSLWIWDLGKRLESYLPRWQFFLAIIVMAISGNLAQYFVVKSLLFGGLSGVVYGLFGFLWIANQYKIKALHIPNGLFVFMAFFLIIGYTNLFETVFWNPPGKLGPFRWINRRPIVWAGIFTSW